MNMKNVCIGAGILLLSALLNIWPYNFYVLLRWVICGLAIYVGYGFHKSKLDVWTLIFGAVAFVFNPIFPVYLSKASWAPIDFVASLLFFIAGFSCRKKI